jgi:hypothetical protein
LLSGISGAAGAGLRSSLLIGLRPQIKALKSGHLINNVYLVLDEFLRERIIVLTAAFLGLTSAKRNTYMNMREDR